MDFGLTWLGPALQGRGYVIIGLV